MHTVLIKKENRAQRSLSVSLNQESDTRQDIVERPLPRGTDVSWSYSSPAHVPGRLIAEPDRRRFSCRRKLRSPRQDATIHEGEALMAISLYSGFVPVCLQLLGGLKTVLQKAEEHATAQKWDTATVLNLRLYPDMFTLERQVRQVCNHALGAGRVAGVALPSLPDQDNNWAEMRSRIDKTVDFLKGLQPNQLDGKDDSDVTVPMGGQPRTMKAQSYLYHFEMPQIGFHTTTAYDILRQVGVNIGKRDYLGSMPS